MAIKHAVVKAPGQKLFAAADWNADHTFLQTDIDHNQITNKHNLTVDIDHNLLTNYAANRHFLESEISHLNILNIGTNTHAEIDTHIADTTIHFSDLSGFDTGDLTEGINLYFTDERVDDRVAALIQNGTGITWTYVDAANTLTANCDLTWAELDKTVSDIADITTKSHTSLTDIGTNTHAQIDTKITEYNAHDHSAADPTQVSHADLTNVTANQHHAQSHTAVSHSDISATGTEINTACDGATAKNAHTHTHLSTTGRTANDHHAQSHTIASHSDTTATGAELNTLTDNSMADTLHRHSELSASDGTPDRALVVDATGRIGIGATPTTKLDVAGDIISRGTIRSTHASDVSKYFIMNYADAANYGELYCFGDFAERDIILTQIANVGIGTTTPGSKLAVIGLPIYANNAAAITGGLAAGDFYRTNADPDPVCVVH